LEIGGMALRNPAKQLSRDEQKRRYKPTAPHRGSPCFFEDSDIGTPLSIAAHASSAGRKARKKPGILYI
jgi:hypothetical protein